MTDVNPNDYASIPKVIELTDSNWSDGYFIPSFNPEEPEQVLTGHGVPHEKVLIQVRSGAVRLTTGSEEPSDEYQGILIKPKDPLVELYAGCVVRFRRARISLVQPVITIERQMAL